MIVRRLQAARAKEAVHRSQFAVDKSQLWCISWYIKSFIYFIVTHHIQYNFIAHNVKTIRHSSVRMQCIPLNEWFKRSIWSNISGEKEKWNMDKICNKSMLIIWTESFRYLKISSFQVLFLRRVYPQSIKHDTLSHIFITMYQRQVIVGRRKSAFFFLLLSSVHCPLSVQLWSYNTPDDNRRC